MKVMFPINRRLRPLSLVVLLLALAPFSVEAAALTYDPGFWVGFGHGLLGLLKLLISPLVDVTIVDPRADSWTYTAGYYLGVLTFASAGGMVASTADPEPVLNAGASPSHSRSAG